MKNLTEFRFSAWNDGDRQACYIEASVPEGKLRKIYFYMSRDEFESFASGKVNSFNDISHNLRSIGDNVTFYDLDFPNKNFGELTVPYVNINFPIFVRKILLKWANKQWNSNIKCHNLRPDIIINQNRLERWVRLYGCGSGCCVLKFYNEKDEEHYQLNKSENFGLAVQHLIKVGENNTFCFFDKVSLNLSKDGEGFYFSFTKHGFKESKQVFFNGGLINHGTKENPNWSIHT